MNQTSAHNQKPKSTCNIATIYSRSKFQTPWMKTWEFRNYKLNNIPTVLPDPTSRGENHPSMLGELHVPLVRQNQKRMDSPNWSALERESRPPHWFSTAICSAVHRPNTSLMASPNAASASAEIGPGPGPPPPPLDAAMVSRAWDGLMEEGG